MVKKKLPANFSIAETPTGSAVLKCENKTEWQECAAIFRFIQHSIPFCFRLRREFNRPTQNAVSVYPSETVGGHAGPNLKREYRQEIGTIAKPNAAKSGSIPSALNHAPLTAGRPTIAVRGMHSWGGLCTGPELKDEPFLSFKAIRRGWSHRPTMAREKLNPQHD